ncbi:MAG: hypothetical protein H0X38_00985 [Planctomycetes bacterium]|nr:hypothetical protein [Planctomycetota bacterium]
MLTVRDLASGCTLLGVAIGIDDGLVDQGIDLGGIFSKPAPFTPAVQQLLP